MAKKEYIDREILLKMNFYTENCNSEENRWNDYAIKDIIRHIPATDVAPVKHGYWIKIENYAFKCTSCGKMYWESEGYAARTHFCPNCGTRMDGDDNT